VARRRRPAGDSSIGPEAVDEDAGRAEAGQFEPRRGAKPEQRAQGEAFEIEPTVAMVLPRSPGRTSNPDVWIAPRQVPVPHERSGMCVAFDAVAAGQCNRKARCLAEAMPGSPVAFVHADTPDQAAKANMTVQAGPKTQFGGFHDGLRRS
jgi:hypothetical protein